VSATALACARCSAELEVGDLRCAVCGLPSPDAQARALAAPRTNAVRCSNCGAAVSYDAAAGAPKCAFCASEMKLERQADPVEEAEATVPFSVSPFDAKGALSRWLGSRGFFRPGDLASGSALEEIRPLLWPAWICSAGALVSWTADTNVGSGRAEWAPCAGQAEMELGELLIPASRGLTLKECRALSPGFRLAEAKGEIAPPPGTVTERFEATRSAARRIIVEGLGDAARERIEREAVPGTRHRKVKVELLLRSLRSRRVALPTYALAYRYREKLYRVLVHGQDAALVTGKAPVSAWRVAAVVIGGALAIALIVALVLLLAGR